jgi:hypothetical protein
VGFSFETVKLKYTPPPKEHTYTPDFLLANGILIEVKGYLTSEDRKKMRWVKEQHPELDIRMLFGRAQNRINKGSPTTYAMWAEKYGFKWCEKVVPQEWVDEPDYHDPKVQAEILAKFMNKPIGGRGEARPN